MVISNYKIIINYYFPEIVINVTVAELTNKFPPPPGLINSASLYSPYPNSTINIIILINKEDDAPDIQNRE